MTDTKIFKDYISPVCEVLDIVSEGVLCASTESGNGSTEDMGDLEDLFVGI